MDIARRAYKNLKKKGYRVFLTRSTDSYLSVLDRFQLAQQLKADLFVSVHINAIPGIERVSGVETHFLDGSPFFGNKKNSLFLLASTKRDRDLVKFTNAVLMDKISSSKKLSRSIQNGICDLAARKRIDVVNRGVKRTGFRTLLRSEVPSSIVEVGFVTNKKEAQRLATPHYRDFLARGISNGIEKFLSY